jgi:tetratricopeptide (TPR) repeat protein
LLCLPFCAVIAAQESEVTSVERYSREAKQALAARDFDTAIEALGKLSQLTPDVPEVHANLGLAYHTQGQFAQAAEAFQRALELNPRMPNSELMLGICYAELGRHEEAVPLLEPAFRQPPNSQIGRLIGLELQRAYSGLQQDAKAGAVSDELVDRYPSDPEILYHASRLHGDRALQLMYRLLKVDPE